MAIASSEDLKAVVFYPINDIGNIQVEDISSLIASHRNHFEILKISGGVYPVDI